MLLPGLFFFVLTFFSPIVSFSDGNVNFRLGSTTFTNLVSGYDVGGDLHYQGTTIYNETFTEELADIIRENTGDDDIFYCNYNYVGGMLSALTGRLISCVLHEVRSPRFDPIRPAVLIIWMKRSDGSFDPALGPLIKKYNLKKVEETDIAYVYRNPSSRVISRINKAALPTRWVFLILFAWIGLLIWSLIKKRDDKTKSY